MAMQSSNGNKLSAIRSLRVRSTSGCRAVFAGHAMQTFYAAPTQNGEHPSTRRADGRAGS